jgi:hypothetical protein
MANYRQPLKPMKTSLFALLISILPLKSFAQSGIYSPNGVTFPSYTTGTRPAANTVGVGTVLYNSTDNTHQYSNGSSWLNLLGTNSVPSGITNQTLRNDGSGWVVDGFMQNTGSRIMIGVPNNRSEILSVDGDTHPGLYVSSKNSAAIRAFSKENYSIYGASTNEAGIFGYSVNGTGIFGSSATSYGGEFYGRVRMRKGTDGDAGIEFTEDVFSSPRRGFIGMNGNQEMMIWGYGYNAAIQRWNIATGAICYATSPTICSDIRLKKDFRNLSNSLFQISQLQGYHYFLKNEKNTNLQTGFIAQEIQKIFPELVYQGLDGYLSVDYVGLIPHLVESMKSLKSENEILKNRLSKIENFLQISDVKLETKR